MALTEQQNNASPTVWRKQRKAAHVAVRFYARFPMRFSVRISAVPEESDEEAVAAAVEVPRHHAQPPLARARGGREPARPRDLAAALTRTRTLITIWRVVVELIKSGAI